MRLNTLVASAVLASVLLFTSSASAAEFSFSDIVKSASFKKRSAKSLGGAGAGSAKAANRGDVTKMQFLVIAQAKESGSQKPHPSTPQVIVDVEPKVPDCKPFDWLFIPHCADAAPRSDVSLPKFNTVKLPRAFLHIYELPYGWKNARIKLPAFGKCQSTRTAAMRVARAGERLCRTAQFRITIKTNKEECKHVPYRSCSFWRCKTKHRKECTTKVVTTYKECSPTYMVIRVFTVHDHIPQVVATTGGIYSGFRSCNDAAAANYFTK